MLKVKSISKTTLFAANYIYKFTLSGEELKLFNHPKGTIEPNNSGSFDYIYQYKYHFGNIRLSYKNINTTSNPVLEIQEENNCHPFGLKHKGYNNVVNGTDHPYGFGGKEEQDELGLDWIDIIARNYDPALGRWMNLDPLAEKLRRHSPYNYAFNNSIFFIDPDGMMPFGIGDPPGTPNPVGYAKEQATAFLTWAGSGAESVSSSVKSGWKSLFGK